MPRTIEVPRENWATALKEFSTMHAGWLVSMDVLSTTIGAQPEVTNLPLVGVTFEPANAGTMTVAVARSTSDHLTHAIRRPRHVWIERTEAGADVALEVESEDGAKTILRFKTAALPESVDAAAR